MPAPMESRHYPGTEQILESCNFDSMVQQGTFYFLDADVVPQAQWRCSRTGKFVLCGFILVFMFLYITYFIRHITSPLDPLFLYSNVPKRWHGVVMWTFCLVWETLVVSTVLLGGIAAWAAWFVAIGTE